MDATRQRYFSAWVWERKKLASGRTRLRIGVSFRAIELHLDHFTALLIAETAKANQVLAKLAHEPHDLLTRDRMQRSRRRYAQSEMRSRLAWISWKLRGDVQLPAPQLQEKTGHHNVGDIHNFLDAGRLSRNPPEAAHDRGN
jgi:hypothetical protein